MFPTKATGIHFNQCGHIESDVRITFLEKMKTNIKLIYSNKHQGQRQCFPTLNSFNKKSSKLNPKQMA